MNGDELTADQHRRMTQRLQDPARYPHAVGTVTTVETHISTLLLTDDYAYKLKKPLDLGFLDFTTLEQRRHACDEELRLNGRLAPAIYLRRIGITGTPDDPAIDGDGAVLDWAVQMRRFDDTRLFDRLLEHDQLTADEIEDVARQMAVFHDAAAVADEDSEWGTPAAVAEPARDNLVALREQLGADPRIQRLKDWTEDCLQQLDPVFRQRHREGRIRECHGDLHLGNIVDVDGRPVIFDGIEFAPELRWIDVMNEVAFLGMDLRSRQRPDLAARFLSTYLEETGDYHGVALLPFYRAYRALVRAKISGLRAADEDAPDDVRERATAARDAYIKVAEAEMQPATPQLVLMHGLSGSGKSTVAQAVVERLGAIRLRSDVERKRLAGLDARSRTDAGVGEGLYGADLSARTYQRLEMLADGILETGTSVVVDAASLRRDQRERFRHLASRIGVPFTLVACEAAENELRERIRRRQQAGTDPSDADLTVLEHQLQARDVPGPEEKAHTLVVDTAADPDFQALGRLSA
ncbi:AAA family ATPase [Aquisalimonas sp. 2447]|uniref:bifunctional aminoglycoside phosphotransferase/ATP-binding protein n=1 Tax=Aquisalimonas sp. 2447 TaxID=2740807 RepID=UPI001432544B|nr:bifunctional aminoglycoside phosphotransferase/ATP-binding protein [Aquisalimonas sp. 2447]QIT53909.1 AAA family ATPase [Aquisalimonas sp. 2447]